MDHLLQFRQFCNTIFGEDFIEQNARRLSILHRIVNDIVHSSQIFSIGNFHVTFRLKGIPFVLMFRLHMYIRHTLVYKRNVTALCHRALIYVLAFLRIAIS